MDSQTYNRLFEANDKDLFVGIYSPSRAILYEMLMDGTRDQTKPVLTIRMPCGEKYLFERREDLPKATLMCKCGNPKHAVVRYSDAFKEK